MRRVGVLFSGWNIVTVEGSIPLQVKHTFVMLETRIIHLKYKYDYKNSNRAYQKKMAIRDYFVIL